MYCKVFICALSLMTFCQTFKILIVFPVAFKSHRILGRSMTNLLLEAGHQVSYITPESDATSHPNLTQISIKTPGYRARNLSKLEEGPLTVKMIFNTALNVSYTTLTSNHVQLLAEDPAQTFDLVIANWGFNDLNSGFSALFNCPYIWFFPFHDDHEILRLIQEFSNPLLTANIRTNNMPVFTFMQRIDELLFFMTTKISKYFHFDPLERKAYEEIFGPLLAKRGRVLPPYNEIRYNASLVFVNSHLTVRNAPVVPHNYKAVGGFHISETPAPLSKEFLSIIENSDNGVVLFSLGSFLKAENLPTYIKRDLLVMFSALNYTILWNIDEHFKDLPPNVFTFSWIPLQSVLAHAKCKLFITHGGLLSLSESVHFGVPIVGIPVFGDQKVNVKTLVKKGVGRMVAMDPKLVDTLKEAIDDLLSDLRYKQNMEALSSLYHDRPLSPGSELVYWVEHVVTTHGAAHLRSPALLLPWYQKYYVDIFASLLIFLISFVFVINKLFVYVINNMKNRFKQKQKKY